jgi:hypothetical protein
MWNVEFSTVKPGKIPNPGFLTRKMTYFFTNLPVSLKPGKSSTLVTEASEMLGDAINE